MADGLLRIALQLSVDRQPVNGIKDSGSLFKSPGDQPANKQLMTTGEPKCSEMKMIKI